MGLQLHTDTSALRPETRQYDFMGKRLGNGVPRFLFLVVLVVGGIWAFLMLVVFHVPLLSRFGPLAWFVPPTGLIYYAIQIDASGRRAAVRWYDALLSRLPNRRQHIANPLLTSLRGRTPRLERVVATAELMPTATDSPVKGH